MTARGVPGAGGAMPLETPRLAGRLLREDDLALLRLLHSDQRVMATLSTDGQVRDEAFTRAVIDHLLAQTAERGLGVWVFHEPSANRFVGYCGVRRQHVNGKEEVELLYAVRTECWNAGYATEMARAVLHHAYERVRPPSVVAFTLPENHASRRVMHKCGFRYEREIVHAGLPHVLYRLQGRAEGGRPPGQEGGLQAMLDRGC